MEDGAFDFSVIFRICELRVVRFCVQLNGTMENLMYGVGGFFRRDFQRHIDIITDKEEDV